MGRVCDPAMTLIVIIGFTPSPLAHGAPHVASVERQLRDVHMQMRSFCLNIKGRSSVSSSASPRQVQIHVAHSALASVDSGYVILD